MSIKVRQKLYNLSKKLEKAYYTLAGSLVAASFLESNAFAAAGAPKIVTGSVELGKAVTSWLLLIIPVGAGTFLGYQAFQKAMTDDQAIIAEKNKLMRNVIIGAAIAETADGFVRIILSFYQ